MKAAFVASPSGVEVREVGRPEPGPGEVAVRMAACGICGSDVEKAFGSYGQPSTRLGHEPAGVVTAVGEGAAGVSAGDRVFTHHHVPCYSCRLCLGGSETMCPRYRETNLSPCGLSEEYVVPAWSVAHGGVLRLPDSVSFEEAAMVEPLACCVRSWGRVGHRRGDSVAVFGAGPTGLMHLMLARHYGLGAEFCLDVNDYRLGFAERECGAAPVRADDPGAAGRVLSATGGQGVDVAVVATGSTAALRAAVGVARPGGTVLMFGVPPRGSTVELDIGRAYSREASIVTSYAASDRDTAAALELIRSGAVRAGGLVTHRYALGDSPAAFERARGGDGAMKVVITG